MIKMMNFVTCVLQFKIKNKNLHPREEGILVGLMEWPQGGWKGGLGAVIITLGKIFGRSVTTSINSSGCFLSFTLITVATGCWHGNAWMSLSPVIPKIREGRSHI